ncbi:MAG: PAS domain S-box protein [Methanomicrobium sp.]|nr:PAS domain S-box protein [Methanomicrobium sp.]
MTNNSDFWVKSRAVFALIILITIMCIAVSYLSLSSGYYILFQNLFYIPIILACVFYLRRGLLFSVILSLLYFCMLMAFAGSDEFLNGIARVILFTGVALLATYLSEKASDAKKEVWEKNEELKSVNEKLKISRDRYHRLFESSADLMFLHRINEDKTPGRLIEVNASACESLGYSQQELRQLTIMDIAGEKGRREAKEQLLQIFEKGDHKFESTQLRKDGTEFPVEVTSHLIRTNEHGDLILSAARDITQRKKAESLLQRTQFAFDHSPDEIYFLNKKGQIIYANAQAKQKFGIESGSATGKTIFDINPVYTQKMLDELWQRHDKEDYIRFESVHTDTNKVRYPVDVINYKISFDGEEYSCSIARDITESKKSKEALLESKGRLRALLQTIPDLIWLKDVNGVYLACNRMFERFFGAPEREITGKTDYDFLDKELADFFRKKDTEAVTSGGPSVNEEWITFADDGRRAYLETIKAPVYDSEGILTGVLGIGRDITERKNSEDAIKEVNKKLNLLSSITRHDILNQITVAAGYLEIIKMDGEISPQTNAYKYIEKISGAVETIKKQITFTGYYKELGEQLPQWIDLGESIKSVAKTSSFSGIKIHDDIHNIEIFADPLFEKVIYNLIDNAVRHGETITEISFYSKTSDSGLVIYCEDDGVGISEDVKEKIFRREHYKNSGLGLFLSREILAITGLTIIETGTPGSGARFEIHVPSGMFKITNS